MNCFRSIPAKALMLFATVPHPSNRFPMCHRIICRHFNLASRLYKEPWLKKRIVKLRAYVKQRAVVTSQQLKRETNVLCLWLHLWSGESHMGSDQQ